MSTCPAVSVAVPVYNGAKFLRDSLECLRTQTFRDIEVVILDNASTDRTPEICAEFAKADPRFLHIRNEKTIPALENFRRSMELTKAPYFMWRADDDRSSPDYIDKLLHGLEEKPSANLAVSPVRRFASTGTKMLGLPSSDRPADLLAGCHAPWLYGLWRRGALAELWQMVDAYPYVWAWDHIAMLPAIARGEVALCPDTEFHQYLHRQASYALSERDLLKARKAYATLAYPFASGGLSKRDINAHLDRRVAPLWKTYRRMVKRTVRGWFDAGSTIMRPST